MSSTVVLTGLLPFVVLVASVLAFPISFLLLRLYRRSVQRGMSLVGGTQAEARVPTAAPHPTAAALQIVVANASAISPEMIAWSPAYCRAANGPWKTSGAYVFAGLAYALVMTAGWLLATQDVKIVWIKLLVLYWTYLWPAVLSVLLIAAYDWRRRTQILGVYFTVLAVLAMIAVARNPGLGMVSLPLYWVLMNGPSTILLATFLIRPIRAVGPLVLAFLIAIAIGSQSLVSMAAASESLLRTIADLGFSLGLNAMAVFAGMMLIGAVIFGLLGWPLMRLIGKNYEQKKFSDQAITLDTLWLLFGIVQSIGLAFEGALWILTGVVAFIVYKLVSGVALRWNASRSVAGDAKTLLLLRVFALAKRSEQLFDKLRKHWQYAGSISMIAGPDLVTTTIEPDEFMSFLGGRLGRQFVMDEQDLNRRFTDIDKAPDPDGRYRINEFFCRSDTWQMTMERLAATSDAVVMDLRGFSQANQGCIFELGRLLDGVDLKRVVFLVDDTTDRGFLESTLQRLWANVNAESPNQADVTPRVRLFRIEHQSEAELKSLVGLLLAGASPASL